MEPAMSQGVARGQGGPAMGQEASNEWSHGASNETGSQQGGREPAKSQGDSHGVSNEPGSPQGAREPAMSERTVDLAMSQVLGRS